MNKKIKVIILTLALSVAACDQNKESSTTQQDTSNSTTKQQIEPKKVIKNSVDLGSLIKESTESPRSELNNDINNNAIAKNTYSDPIQALNSLRAVYGLNQLYDNRQLDFAAQKHAYYLSYQSQPSHFETEGSQGFFGKDPMERALKSNYSNTSFSVGEVLAFYDGERKDDLEKFLVAIYHRFLILEPKYNEVGSYYIKNGETNIIEIMLGVRGQSPNTNVQFSYYPYDNQINVPTLFYPSQEIPNPLPDREVVGYPITFQVSSGNNLDITNFTLTDSLNNNMDGKVMSSATDEHLTSSQFGFIPYQKLMPNKTYTALIKGTVNNTPFFKKWSFTTQAEQDFIITLDKEIARPGDVVNLTYKGVETRSVNMMSRVVGSNQNLVKVNSQTWGSIKMDVLKGCMVESGCDVYLTLSDSDSKQKTVKIKVMP